MSRCQQLHNAGLQNGGTPLERYIIEIAQTNPITEEINSMMYRFIRTTFIITIALSFAFLGCNNGSTSPYGGSTSTTTTKASPNTVAMTNFTFSPSSLTITKGTVVTWQNNDGVAHTSTSDNGVWDTGNILPAGNKTTTFGTAGTFAYHCTVHPMMTGTIVVQ